MRHTRKRDSGMLNHSGIAERLGAFRCRIGPNRRQPGANVRGTGCGRLAQRRRWCGPTVGPADTAAHRRDNRSNAGAGMCYIDWHLFAEVAYSYEVTNGGICRTRKPMVTVGCRLEAKRNAAASERWTVRMKFSGEGRRHVPARHVPTPGTADMPSVPTAVGPNTNTRVGGVEWTFCGFCL